jgi:DUF4097 and DUF4098 domain-containing protein YvlB
MLATLMAAVMLSAPLWQQTDTIVPVDPDTRLEVSQMGGVVVVRTWDRSEMRVVSDHSSRERVEISRSGRVVKVRAKRDRGVAHSVDFEITIPASMDVEISGTFLDIDIEGVQGEVSAHTTQGDVRLVGGGRYVNLHSIQGEVTCTGARGRLEIGSVNGSVRVRDVVGEIAGETVNGSIILEDVQSSAVELVTTNGDIYYGGTVESDGRYFFSNHNGDLTLAVPGSINATVSVSTFSGEFDSDFPVTLTETRSGGKRFSFVLGLGDGGARIELESFAGTIRLRRP